MDPKSHLSWPRRRFLETSATTAALAAGAFPRGVQAQREEGELLRIGLVGCGGRGTGAAAQALAADDQTRLWAMADVDADGLERSRQTLEKNAPRKGSVDVAPDRRFLGLDAYQQLMDRDDIDVVILTTPPGFRPYQFEAAVAAGKHVFMEKPVAVDAPGVRRVLDAARVAREKNLKVGVGLNRRHSPIHEACIERIHDGMIGEIPLIQLYNCRADVNKRQVRRPDETELQFQVRNWYYFTWLSGDFPVEQSVHEYDVVRWIKQEANPVSCQGQGGRLVRTGPQNGQIYDHFMMEYRFADGSQVIAQHRHIPGCWTFFGEKVSGTKGKAELSFKRNGWIQMAGAGENEFAWRETEKLNSYQIEHDRLFAAIREDTPFQEAERGAYSSLFAIMGRMASYTGQEITWEEALASEEALAFSPKSWDEAPPVLPNEDLTYDPFLPGRSAG